MTQSSEFAIATRVLALSHFCGLTPLMFEVLLRRFETLNGIYEANREDFLAIDGMADETADLLDKVAEQLEAAEELATQLAQRDIKLITRFDADYNPRLFELNNPPSLLYVRGRSPDSEARSVAVVGCHEASSEGIALTAGLVKELVGHQVQIISSLVGGIDMTAHLAARGAKGSSFAVLDRGLDHLDPQAAVPVAIDLVQSGGVLAEYAPSVPANDMFVAQAGRLILGLAQAVVVTEVYADSSHTLELLETCRDLGKLTFLMVDPNSGALADETSLSKVIEYGAITIEGFERVGDIIKSLV